MKDIAKYLLIFFVAGGSGAALAADAPSAEDNGTDPKVYVPYKDIAAVLDPAAKAVLMDRKEFAKLLAAAKANEKAADSRELGQVVHAKYTAEAKDRRLIISGELTVRSMSDKPVAVPFQFARLGLLSVKVGGKDAPLGYDSQGRLVLVVTGKGTHKVIVWASAALQELSLAKFPAGGMQFSIAIPAAVAGGFSLSAVGDLEVSATAPVAARKYDKQADRTTADMTIGGREVLTVALIGNGRQEDQQAILLSETTTSVELTKTHQMMNCIATVEILRRGVREMTFSVDSGWTVTDVSCPDVVNWSVVPEVAGEAKSPQLLTVRLRTARRGTEVLHIKATAAMPAGDWRSPRVTLKKAAFQRGYLLVDTGSELRVRGEQLLRARREDRSAAALPQVMGVVAGRLYYHWSHDWRVTLETTTVALRRGSEGRQYVIVAPEHVTLLAHYQVTAIGREMFDITFDLPPKAARWEVASVTVGAKKTGFEYRIVEADGKRTLRLELARPVQPEATAAVSFTLKHTPDDWLWPAGAKPRELSVPLLRCQADTISGIVSVSTGEDLQAEALAAPGMLKTVTAARMSSLGLGRNVQIAYVYKAAPGGALSLRILRKSSRVSAKSVGLVSVRPKGLSAAWRITYTVSRARTKKLTLLADSSLGEEIRIDTGAHRLTSKIRTPAAEHPTAEHKGYDIWTLNLDAQVRGRVTVNVQYDRPLPSGTFPVPLVRPYGATQAGELVAIQASEELAVDAAAEGVREIDTIDLPALPAPARRLLAAYRLEGGPGKAAIKLTTTVHDNLDIPAALVTSADFTTYLGADGSQRAEATFHLVNAGLQFLAITLPDGADLWSVSVAGRQSKPKQDSAGNYLVAVPRATSPVPVRVVYAQGGGDLDDLTLARASLQTVKVNKVTWRVVCPPGYRITSQETQMQTKDITRTPPAYETFLRAAAYVATGPLRMSSPMMAAREGIDLPGYKMAYDKTAAPPRDGALAAHGEPDETEAGLAVRQAGVRALPAVQPTTQPARPGKKKPPKGPDKPETKKEYDYWSIGLRARGRYTLPVKLTESPAGARVATFTGIGQGDLIVELSNDALLRRWALLGFALIGLAGILRVRRTFRQKATFIITVLVASILLAIWSKNLTPFVNGAFFAALALIIFYLAAALAVFVAGKILPRFPFRSAATATAAMLIAMGICANAAAAAKAPAPKPAPPKTPAKPTPAARPLIVPYEGDPIEAAKSTKVLVPYRRYVELWNRANPDDPIDLPAPAGGLSLAGPRYEATIKGKEMHVELSVRVRALGKRPVTLAMPISGMAVMGATLDGKTAPLSVGAKGMVLTLPAKADGILKVRAITTPKRASGRTSVDLTLPPLPAAVWTIVLPDENLILEAPGLAVAPVDRKVAGGVEWTVPLGSVRKLSLRWAPKAGGGKTDRTLSASADHNVHFYHWAVIGVSRLTYTFSATDYEQFGLLLPPDARLTSLSAANLRDYRVVGEKTLEGEKYAVVQIRLHRPAKKRFEVTARWLADLPAFEKPAVLRLPRAADVGRESGNIAVHAAGGMTVKVPTVTGGRRKTVAPVKAHEVADVSRPVAAYYWPYRPFALSVEIRRHRVEASAEVAQLVRISPQRVQLLVQVDLRTTRGRVFDASFALPDGYELLSATGSAVRDFYVQPTPTGRRLHVYLRGGISRGRLALVLVREDVKLGRFHVPSVMMVDAGGQPLAKQTGRLAVQLAGSLNAHTVGSENLKAARPALVVGGWLRKADAAAVQFAYRYDKPKISLDLNVEPRPSKTRVEIFSGVTVRPTAAWYTYRLRYNITGSPVDQVSFTLPTSYAPLVDVRCPSMRSTAKADAGGGRTRWTVTLTGEVTGVLDVAVNFAMNIDAATARLEIPRIETPAPEGYHAVTAVQNFSRHELSVGDAVKLTPLPLAEQKKLLSGAMRKSLQYVFQSYTPDWSLSLNLKAAKVARRIPAVVDLMAVTTVIDRSGKARYQVDLMLQNRSEQFLRLVVPKELTLWSAYVDGQAVKPVIEGAGAGRVLIPLVKTSPGGLPYEVKLYLGGKAGGSLGRVSKIKPPAIAVEDIDVMRMTWSLRLPAGYRYRYARGMADTGVDVLGCANNLVAVLQAQYDQVGRYSGLQDSVQSSRGRAMLRPNWKVLNKELDRTRDELQRFVGFNLSVIGREQHDRFQDIVAGNLAKQKGLQRKWAQNEGTETARGNADITSYLNTTANNPGTLEVTRDRQLNLIPEFVVTATEGQMKNIRMDLKQTEESIKELQMAQAGKQLGKKGYSTFTKDASGKLGVTSGTYAAGLLRQRDTAGDEIALEALARETGHQTARQQDQLKQQLSQFADNRMLRNYQRAQGQGMGQGQGQAAGQAQPRGGQLGGGTLTTTGRIVTRNGGIVTAGGDVTGRIDGGGRRTAQPQTGRPADPMAVTGAGKPKPGWRTKPVYVARGTFSLPVQLPEGGVVYNFSAPGGRAEVSIWAFRDDWAGALEATGVIALLLIALYIGRTLWRFLRGQADLPEIRQRIAVAAALVIVLTGLFGFVGFLLGVAAAALAEGSTRLARRPAA